MWQDGIIIFKFALSLFEILIQPGDWFDVTVTKPSIASMVEIFGVDTIAVIGDAKVEVRAYNADQMKNWFLINSSGINTGDVIW